MGLRNFDRLHENITNAERLEVVGEFPIAEILTAPGHTVLRNPGAVTALAGDIARGDLDGLLQEPILLGIFTIVEAVAVRLRSVECLDGHHRLLAGLLSGAWKRIGDLPAGAVDTRVNGWRADGDEPEARWIPLDVVHRSSLRENDWSIVPPEWGAKGPTARISGAISSLDDVFAPADRGVRFADLARLVADD